MSDPHVVSPAREWWTSLFAMRPWLVVSSAVAVAVWHFGLSSSAVVMAIGGAVGLLDSLWTYISIGCSRIVIRDGFVVFERWPWHHEVDRAAINADTIIQVRPVVGSWILQWLSSAYPCYAEAIVLGGKPDGLDVLVKTPRQIARLQARATRVLEEEKRHCGF